MTTDNLKNNLKMVHHRGLNIAGLQGQDAELLDQIGLGMRLRVPHGGSGFGAWLVDGTRQGRDPWPVSELAVQRLLEARILLPDGRDMSLLFKMTKERCGDRAGWLEKGLDGDVADFFCLRI